MGVKLPPSDDRSTRNPSSLSDELAQETSISLEDSACANRLAGATGAAVPIQRTRSRLAPADTGLGLMSSYRSVKYKPSGPAAKPTTVALPVPLYTIRSVGPCARL